MALAFGDTSLGWLAGEDARAARDGAAGDIVSHDIATLVSSFSGLLYRVAFSVVRQPAEAEDIVQETFVRVLEDAKRLNDVRELRPWLVRIAWNLALDRKRRITPSQMDEVVAGALVSREQPADHVLAEARELAEVLAVLDRLPKLEREVLLLSAVEELTAAEIASVLKRSESSVRSIAFRARARLQERMKGGRG